MLPGGKRRLHFRLRLSETDSSRALLRQLFEESYRDDTKRNLGPFEGRGHWRRDSLRIFEPDIWGPIGMPIGAKSVPNPSETGRTERTNPHGQLSGSRGLSSSSYR